MHLAAASDHQLHRYGLATILISDEIDRVLS